MLKKSLFSLPLLASALLITASAHAGVYQLQQYSPGLQPAKGAGASAASCALPWGGTLVDGRSVLGYTASSVTAPNTCAAISSTLSCNNGTLSSTSGTTTGLLSSCVENKNLVIASSARNWSDGSYAASCFAYKTGDATHFYSGATGDGLYRVNPDGNVTTVYCDMTNGGWTMIGKGTADVNVAGWYAATGNYNVPASPNPSASETWKYADTLINAFPKSVYKVVVLVGYPGTWYASGNCVYAHQGGATATNKCGSLYSNESLTTLVQTGNGGANGISDYNGTSSYHLLTNNPATYSTNGWCAGNGSPGAGGCANAGTRVSIVMWVK